MHNPRLAARYAKSLLDLAIERNELEVVYQDNLFLQSVCKSSRDFVNLLKSPIIPADKKEKILESLSEGKVSTLTFNFTKLLLRKNRESHLPEIIHAFIQQYKDFKGIHTVHLTTATPVSEELKSILVEKLKATTTMQHIELNTEVRESIIGGFILEVGDRLVDASIAFDLNSIKQQFRNNDFIFKLR